MILKAAFKEGKKMVKFTRYLDEVPIQGKVETSMLSKNFCLSSSAAAGIFVGKHGGFIKVKPGLWMKTDKKL